MIAAIFEDYVRFMDRRLDTNNRQVLFVIDNCPSHGKIDNLKAIALEFLIANNRGTAIKTNGSGHH
ncbi:hypothetical protein HPB48_017268 [Haemaphysalis longicornis]|uniref:DDE-1 domain-containing protein n=1 Tax=Haemaphysalis longicornis TaxID=44386 RepID=A0A9J6FQ08_HAELO|nr:hypothetical protein HPB48_017268 [Haemaphysalis longicornis]